MGKQCPKVLLDTNVWRALADAGAGEMLRRVAKRSRAKVQIAPAVVYEALRTPDVGVRGKQLALMTDPEWARLMPEAYSESQEVLAEAKRRRPQWLRNDPDTQSFRRLEHDWRRSKGGFWDRARLDTAAEAALVGVLGNRDITLARSDAGYARARYREAGWHFDGIDLAKVKQQPDQPVQGWEGDELEPWRWDALAAFFYAFGLPDGAYVDWLSPFVSLIAARTSGESWVRFWLYDVATLNMKRCWMRWAMKLLQSLRSVSSGTPGDNQLGTYLVECDYLISADRTFVDIVRKCRDSAPFRIAVPVPVSGGERSVSDVAQALDDIGKGRAGGDRR